MTEAPRQPQPQKPPQAGWRGWAFFEDLRAAQEGLLSLGFWALQVYRFGHLRYRFESKLIQTALLNTRGRRIEAAQKLGIGRNTITRKIQELNLE